MRGFLLSANACLGVCSVGVQVPLVYDVTTRFGVER